MRDLAVLFIYPITTVARLTGPGGARSVVAESVLVKQQLLILNRTALGRIAVLVAADQRPCPVAPLAGCTAINPEQPGQS